MKLPSILLKLLVRIAARVRASRDPDFIIGGPVHPYMYRWHAIPRNKFFNIYLHRFMRSDDDRALHDHPWWNVSILLEGSYTEHTIPAGGVNVRQVYQAGEIKFRGAKSAHRVELHSGECKTLFITGPNIRDWGFHCPAGWRPWQEFTTARDGKRGEIGRGCD